MSNDSDLKRMFDDQRKVDEGLAPSFDDIHAASVASHNNSPGSIVHQSLSLSFVVAGSVIGLSVVIAILAWTYTPQPDVSYLPARTQTDLRKLHQTCDALLVTIREMDSPASTQSSQETDWEMEWSTETDVLIPFDTLSFNIRTSR